MPPDVLVTRPKRARRLGLLLAGASVALGAAGAAWFFRFAWQVRRDPGVVYRDPTTLDNLLKRASDAERAGDRQRVLIAAAQQLRLAALAAAPDGPHGVDHVARGEPVGARDPRLPSRATTDPAALLQELGARRAVNRTIHTAAA